MAGKFYLRKFSEINLNDSFFDTLKEDYPAAHLPHLFQRGLTRKHKKDALHLYSMMNKVWAHLFV